ncbi:MAG: hypothetical protein R3F07_08180 [Opitutaceae bacterium]
MKSGDSTPRFAIAGVIGLALITLFAAFKVGDTAWSKRIDTPVLAEPKPLASPVGKVGFAVPLKVREVRGAWLGIQADEVSGWVFEGNVAGEKPTLAPATGLTRVTADSTDTAAAARPLTEAADGYASRHSEAKDKADVEWVDTTSAGLPEDEVIAYLQENAKGEYRR